jgi:DNA-binding winged helix-turn-helix (wHTH) protein
MPMEHEVSFSRHRFDPRTGRLWAGRREVKLTPRAAAVLAVLIERAGQPVTRDELFQSVWRDVVVGDAALTACIQELRGALDDNARRPRFIETRHRGGYRFVARMVAEVAGCFETALDIARRQGALALERRALRSLGTVRAPQGEITS